MRERRKARALRGHAGLSSALLVLVSLAASPAAAQAPAGAQLLAPGAQEAYGLYAATIAVPQQYILTNESALPLGDALASHPGRSRAQRALIFTTLRFGDAPEEDVLGMLSTFCSHLHRQGALRHTLLITTEERTWQLLRARGLPAYLDRAFPRRSAYVAKVKPHDTFNREFDVQKHWWGWRLSSLGFRVLYMDSDAIVLRDPLEPFEQPYDVQGLTDWQNLDSPELTHEAMLTHPCSLYRATEEPRMATGTIWRESFNLGPGTPAFLQNNPCQSTGVWYLQPTPSTVAFIRAVMERIAYHAVYQWDQTAWNEIIIVFLMGAGDHPQLRYRLLPFSECSNIDTYRARKAKALPLRLRVLHLGGVYGHDKVLAFQREGLFDGNFSLSAREQRALDPGRPQPRWYSAAGEAGAGVAARLGSGPRLLALLLVPACMAAGVYAVRRRGRRPKKSQEDV